MAYNYFPQSYQPLYPTQPNAYPTAGGVGANPSNAQNPLIWVQGEAGAKSYLVAPNQTVVLWDSEGQTIYLKSADTSGMPSIRILDYTIRENGSKTAEIQPQTEYATRDELIALQKEINVLKRELQPRKGKESE